MLGFLRAYFSWPLNSIPPNINGLLIFLSQYFAQKCLACIGPKVCVIRDIFAHNIAIKRHFDKNICFQNIAVTF